MITFFSVWISFAELPRHGSRKGNNELHRVLYSSQGRLQVVGRAEKVEGNNCFRGNSALENKRINLKKKLQFDFITSDCVFFLLFYLNVQFLFSLQAHLNTCKHDAVPCGNKCGAMIPRVLMEDHLKYTCAQRRARCDFCAKEFTGLTLEV